MLLQLELEKKKKKVFCSFHHLNICVYNMYMMFSSYAQNLADETAGKKEGKIMILRASFYIDLYP